MKQLTKKEAIKIGKSGVWKTWTDEQVVRMQLFQTLQCVGIERFSSALSAVLQRPVMTHEIALNRQGLIEEYLGCKSAPTSDEIIALIPKQNRILAFLGL